MDGKTWNHKSKFTSGLAGWLKTENFSCRHDASDVFERFVLTGIRTVTLICIDLDSWSYSGGKMHPLQAGDENTLVLWEDVWYRKTDIVKSRLRALLGISVRIPARLTRVDRVDKPTGDHFLEAHHMQGSTAARYRFGLFLARQYFNRLPANLIPQGADRLLVAVASFAAPRVFRPDEVPYKSGELIRIASHTGTSVVGGVSKLVNHFAYKYQADDVMTYADSEWSTGASFISSGFEAVAKTDPVHFVIDRENLDRYPLHRIDNKILNTRASRLVSVQNAGSIKYVKKFIKTSIQEAPPKLTGQSPAPDSVPPYDIIFVVGPTASGKTALAVRIAYELGGEIISLDSRQVFKGMDIGSGKDLHEYKIDQRSIPFHLIDIVPPATPYSVHHFRKDFETVYKRLRIAGKPIIACGGSGLYIEAVLKHITETGVPGFIAPSVLVIGLNPPAVVRRERIGNRLRKRLDEGLIEEVKALITSGVPASVLINYGLEYKYVTLFLQEELSYDEMTKRLLAEIIRFSKRQVTYLNKIDRNTHVIKWL